MRIGDLAKTTGVPVATLKFYLREGLLPAGTPTAVNQAEYDDVHVRRVKLVRALLHLGGLSIADAQRVLAAVDDETMPIHDAFGVAQDAMVPKLDRSGTRYADALAEVDRFRFIVATHLDGQPIPLGGLGPLWAVYEPDAFPEMASKPASERFALCPWGLYHVEVQ